MASKGTQNPQSGGNGVSINKDKHQHKRELNDPLRKCEKKRNPHDTICHRIQNLTKIGNLIAAPCDNPIENICQFAKGK